MGQTNNELFKRLALAGVFSSVITLVIWLAYNDRSPLFGFLSGNCIFGFIEVVVTVLNCVPLLLGAWLGIIISRNPHNINPIPIYVLMFVQWFAVGYLLSGRVLKSAPSSNT